MKSLFMAAAAAPLLAACATAAADESSSYRQEAEAGDQRVLVVNGERIEIDEGENAGRVIVRAMQDAGDEANIILELNGMEWSPEDRAEFQVAMAEMAREMEGMDFDMDLDFDFDEMEFDGEGPHAFFFSDGGEHLVIDIDDPDLSDEEREELIREHAERMSELQERVRENQERVHVRVQRVHEMADRARREGERAHIMGLRAGAMGMEAGMMGINRALERGYVIEDGERRDLTAEEIADLEEARDDLKEELDEFREEHADALALIESDHHQVENIIVRRHGGNGENVFVRRMGDGEEMEFDDEYEWRFEQSDEADGERQEVRVEMENGERRVWVNGEELEGEALDAWLEEHDELDGGRVRIRIETDEEEVDDEG